jgi:DNA-binding NtrC family response regulator
LPSYAQPVGLLGNVLILARDEVVGALLGLLVELQGFRPMFPGRYETAGEALRRAPLHAVLIDFDHPECSERLLSEIRKEAARPVLFSPFALGDQAREFAAREGARFFILPTDPETFSKALRL